MHKRETGGERRRAWEKEGAHNERATAALANSHSTYAALRAQAVQVCLRNHSKDQLACRPSVVVARPGGRVEHASFFFPPPR